MIATRPWPYRRPSAPEEPDAAAAAAAAAAIADASSGSLSGNKRVWIVGSIRAAAAAAKAARRSAATAAAAAAARDRSAWAADKCSLNLNATADTSAEEHASGTLRRSSTRAAARACCRSPCGERV
jgi:hypothetical protein